MAYQTQAISAITSIPALVAAFAAAQGWTVDNTTPTQPIFTLPTTDTLIKWKLSAAISGQDHTLTWTASGSAVPTSTANTRSPKFAPPTGTTAVPQLPTTLHMFISPAPTETPYLAIVIEYGANLFRHLYLGRMERLGNYSGGEIVSGCSGPHTATSGVISYRHFSHTQYLFSGRSSLFGTTGCGGVNVNHADNPNTWRKFVGVNGSSITLLPNDTVMGGINDGVNDGFYARGEAPFIGANLLVPLNLYTVKPITGDVSFIPIGRPPGVRGVHMANIDPGSSIEVGMVNWRVFPAFAKSELTDMPGGIAGSGYWRTAETSHMIGYAYREN